MNGRVGRCGLSYLPADLTECSGERIVPRRQPEPRASHLWSLLLPAWLFLCVLLPWDPHATKNENLEAHSKQSSAAGSRPCLSVRSDTAGSTTKELKAKNSEETFLNDSPTFVANRCSENKGRPTCVVWAEAVCCGSCTRTDGAPNPGTLPSARLCRACCEDADVQGAVGMGETGFLS